MKFCKLIKYDLKNGIKQCSIKLSLIAAIAVLFCVDCYIIKSNTYIFDEKIPSATFIDYVFYIFEGMREYIPSKTEGFVFPIRWVLMHMLLYYSTLYYPYRDLTSLGLHILPRSRGRLSWWLSKSIWNVCTVSLSYLVIFITVLIFCFATGEIVSLSITPMFINSIFQGDSPFETFPGVLTYVALFLPLLISIGISLLQMTLTLFIKPLFSFGIIAILMLSSAYLATPLLPGNYLMPIRYEFVIVNGLRLQNGIIVFFLLVLFSVIIGCIRFRRYDILNLE